MLFSLVSCSNWRSCAAAMRWPWSFRFHLFRFKKGGKGKKTFWNEETKEGRVIFVETFRIDHYSSPRAVSSTSSPAPSSKINYSFKWMVDLFFEVQCSNACYCFLFVSFRLKLKTNDRWWSQAREKQWRNTHTCKVGVTRTDVTSSRRRVAAGQTREIDPTRFRRLASFQSRGALADFVNCFLKHEFL